MRMIIWIKILKALFSLHGSIWIYIGVKIINKVYDSCKCCMKNVTLNIFTLLVQSSHMMLAQNLKYEKKMLSNLLYEI